MTSSAPPASAPDRASEPPPQQGARERVWLLQFLNILTPLAALFGLVYVLSGAWLGHWELWVAAALAGGMVAGLWTARRWVQAGRLAAAAVLGGSAILAIALSFSLVLPVALPTLVVMPVGAIALVMPYLHGRTFTAFSAASVAVGVAAAAVALLAPNPVPLPPLLARFLVLGTLAVALGLVALLLLQYAHRLRQSVQALLAANAALGRARTREGQLREQAEAASRAKDEFLATLSHELRTPLSAVLGWAQMLGTGQLSPERQRHAAEVIGRNARAQAQIVEDLLDVSRIITGKLQLDVTPVDLAELVREAADAVRAAAEAKDITLVLSLADEARGVAGDAARLRQVAWNLLCNAVKFTSRHGEVHVRLERVDGAVRLTVRDDGQGIAPDFLPHVFDRFRQADGSTLRAHGGLGLGLAIVRHLVEMHGGTVQAHSAGPGQGATFTVDLPQAEPLRHALPGARPGAPAAPRLEGVRVLVADAHEDTRELLVTVLQSHGAQVRAVPSAEEAVRAVREERPHVLVSDLALQGTDGHALIARVRALAPEEGGRTPAVALTAYAGTAERVRALAAGYQTHVPRPVDPLELAVVVAALARPLA